MNTNTNRKGPRRRLTAIAAAGVAVAIASIAGSALASSHPAARNATVAAAKPTTVLVNGAWASIASWDGVIERLQAERYIVYAPPNPLRSLKGDAQTIADFLKTIKGPIVLVGHSYGAQ